MAPEARYECRADHRSPLTESELLRLRASQLWSSSSKPRIQVIAEIKRLFHSLFCLKAIQLVSKCLSVLIHLSLGSYHFRPACFCKPLCNHRAVRTRLFPMQRLLGLSFLTESEPWAAVVFRQACRCKRYRICCTSTSCILPTKLFIDLSFSTLTSRLGRDVRVGSVEQRFLAVRANLTLSSTDACRAKTPNSDARVIIHEKSWSILCKSFTDRY